MISGHGTIATAVEATREGAFDFLEKPLSKERLLVAVRNALKMRSMDRDLRALREHDRRRRLMVGESAAMREIRAQIARVGATPARILITGESGTGKELVARAVHEASERAGGPFVKVNCAAIPEELIESELFGAVKGAYTGATESRDGKFLQADGGTLFLDEVGDMSLRAQAKVLRALQEGEIERVGGNATITVDVRVIAATNKDLTAEVAAGTFREDLLFRLAVVPVHVPPLRDRGEDVPLLAEHLLLRYLEENGLPPREFAPEALRMLTGMPWPGNVRELGNLVERLAILAPERVIGAEDVARLAATSPGGRARTGSAGGGEGGVTATRGLVPLQPPAVLELGGLVAARQSFEAACIAEALRAAAGNVSQAARLLGIDRTNLHKKIQAYELDVERSRGGGESA
jgi:two-component system nitrogen regulation response regulator NtrX